jgi:metal-responsive CopG/Arc/MetJ family transcriptional regulator
MNNDRLVITSRKYTGDTSVISSRLPSDMIRELDKIAEKTKRNRNEIVAICLEYALENLTINDDNAIA